jgi:hypothetical protein
LRLGVYGATGPQNGSIVVRITPGGALRDSGFATSPAPTMTWRQRFGKSSITFVTDLSGAESYRFFFEVGTDFEYELALHPAVDYDFQSEGGFERGRSSGDAGAFVE